MFNNDTIKKATTKAESIFRLTEAKENRYTLLLRCSEKSFHYLKENQKKLCYSDRFIL